MDLSTTEFARQTGVLTGTLVPLEADKRLPTFASVPKFATAYGLTPMEFCGLWFSDPAAQEGE